jgi:hypothetical protein
MPTPHLTVPDAVAFFAAFPHGISAQRDGAMSAASEADSLVARMRETYRCENRLLKARPPA